MLMYGVSWCLTDHPCHQPTLSPFNIMIQQGFLSTDQAAQLLNVHVNTIIRWINEGRLPASQIGREYRIPAKPSKTEFKVRIQAHASSPSPTRKEVYPKRQRH